MKSNKRPYWLTYGLIFILAAVLALIFIPRKKQDSIQIGLITTELSNQEELDSIFQYLKKYPFLKYETINLKEKQELNLKPYDVIWYQQLDTSSLARSLKSKNFKRPLKEYISNGGNLLLTMDAVKYLQTLKLEKNALQTAKAEAKDYGYGRKRGLHAYKHHPVFKDMHGGSYIFSPKMDTLTRQVGFFNESVPSNGKVIAVDWAYITLEESNKLMLEYQLGKGKIIGIGAYTIFHIPNYHRPQLEKFMNNVLGYMTGFISGKKYYWDYSENEVKEISVQTEKSHIPQADAWEEQGWKLKFRHNPTNNFFDVAGERMVIMGNEKTGIEEIWAHPFMPLRDYQVGYRLNDADPITWLQEENQKVTITPNAFARNYEFNQSKLREIITVDIEDPAGVVHYEYSGHKPIQLFIKYNTRMRFMWPYSSKVTGTIQHSWDKNLNAFIFKDRTEDLVCITGFNQVPRQQMHGKYNHFTVQENILKGTATEELMAGIIAQFELKPGQKVDFLITASNEGYKKTLDVYQQYIQNPKAIFQQSKEYYSNLLTRKLSIQSPDEDFNEAYKWALVGTDRFFVHTPGLGKSLVAGYATTAKGWSGGHKINGRPGYAWYFGRDGQWSGFALNGYGDFEKVRDILDIYIRFQNASGKIFHELTTSGAVHYDAADATPLFIVLAGHYLRHSGDERYIKENWASIKKAIDFCFSTDRNNDHLIENTLVGHGWVEGGHLFGGRSTLHLSGCWAAALKEASQMAEIIGKKSLADEYSKEAETVKKIINSTFWNEEKQFFHHSINTDGSFIEDITVMPAIPLYYRQIEKEKQEPVLLRFAKNNFSSDWGMRIASMENEHFNPRGYHTGSVWPLYTGWTALAEYKNNRPVQGYMHTMNNLWVYKHWAKGFVEEVLHGLEYRPSGVCAHQCWSETMALQPLIEGMIGFKPNALKNQMKLTPAFPVHWDHATVSNLKMGDHNLTFTMERTDKATVYHFAKQGAGETQVEFHPVLAAGSNINNVTLNGVTIDYELNEGKDYVWPSMQFTLKDKARIVMEHSKGIGVVPVTYNPSPGDASNGIRIISAELSGNSYQVKLEGPAGSQKDFMIWLGDKAIRKVNGARVVEELNPFIKLEVSFEGKQKKQQYRSKKIEVILHASGKKK